MKKSILFVALICIIFSSFFVYAQDDNSTTDQNTTDDDTPPLVCPPLPNPSVEILATEAYYNNSILKLPLRILIKQGDIVTLQQMNLTIKNVIDEEEIASKAVNAQKQEQISKLRSQYQEDELVYKQLRKKYDDLHNENYIIDYNFEDIRSVRENLLKSLEAENLEDIQVNVKLFGEELNVLSEKINTAQKRTLIQWVLQNATSILASLTLTGLIVTWIAKYYHKTKALVREKAILKAKLEHKNAKKHP